MGKEHRHLDAADPLGLYAHLPPNHPARRPPTRPYVRANTHHLGTMQRCAESLLIELTRDEPHIAKAISLARSIAKLGEIHNEELAWNKDD